MPIHPTAIIDARAEIDSTAEIGPYVVVDGAVRIGPRTRVMAQATILGWTELGADNVVHPTAVLGGDPQDLKYAGAPTYLRIGDRNVFREHMQVHRGTAPESATVIGNDNYFMAASHVAHNCHIGNQVILVNGSMLGGHVEVNDQAIISGNCTVHQFCRVGRLSMMRGMSRSSRDVPPFCILDELHVVRGINRVGLRRAGMSVERIRAIQRAFARLFGSAGNLSLRVAALEEGEVSDDVRELIDFIRGSKRGVAAGPRQRQVQSDD